MGLDNSSRMVYNVKQVGRNTSRTLTSKYAQHTRKDISTMAKKATVAVNTNVIPETLSHDNVKQVKYYSVPGVGKFATSSNWKLQGQAPRDKAKPTTLVTKKGFEVTLFHESLVEAYDYEADAKKRQAIKDLNAELRDVVKAFMAHEIDAKQFTRRQAEIAKAITELSSL